MHNWCYHGTVDETVALLEDGRTVPRNGNIGPPVDRSNRRRVSSRSTTWRRSNPRSRRATSRPACSNPRSRTSASCSRNPAITPPSAQLCTKYGALLIIDETHTISAGPGGATQAWALEPDIVTIGKTLGAGIASGAYGMTEGVRDLVYGRTDARNADVGGIGGTLAGNALSLAAMRATLGDVMTDEAFDEMIALGERFEAGRAGRDRDARPAVACRAARLPRRIPVPRAGRRETAPKRPRRQDEVLDPYIHLYMLNRGILITPFHNMALMSPATTTEDVDRHTEIFSVMAAELA